MRSGIWGIFVLPEGPGVLAWPQAVHMMKGGSGKVPQCFLHTRLTLRPFSIHLRTEYSGQTKPLQTVLHHTTMTLLCKNKGQGGPGMEHTAPGTHFPLLFSRDTEMGPRSLDNSYKKDVRVTVQTTKVTCGKGQSGLRVLFPLSSQLKCAQRMPTFCPSGPQCCLFPWDGGGQTETLNHLVYEDDPTGDKKTACHTKHPQKP